MLIPKPAPGLVIRYAYLWADEHETGQEEGSKDRPVAIVLAADAIPDQDAARVVVVPITHARPAAGQNALEIPQATKRRLGLDDERSWVVLDEVNVFIWPGPDVRPVPGRTPSTIAYGMLPASFTRSIRDGVVALQAAARMRRVPRSE